MDLGELPTYYFHCNHNPAHSHARLSGLAWLSSFEDEHGEHENQIPVHSCPSWGGVCLHLTAAALCVPRKVLYESEQRSSAALAKQYESLFVMSHSATGRAANQVNSAHPSTALGHHPKIKDFAVPHPPLPPNSDSQSSWRGPAHHAPPTPAESHAHLDHPIAGLCPRCVDQTGLMFIRVNFATYY